MNQLERKIRKLRKDFFKAFKKSTGKTFPNEIQHHKSDEHWDPIRKEIKRRIGMAGKPTRLMNNVTFRKLLFDEINFNFYPVNLNYLRQYIENVNDDKPISQAPNNNEKRFFPGSIVVDQVFIDKIKGLSLHFSAPEFYMAKQTPNCQWWGIIKNNNLDVVRKQFNTIKKQVCSSFEEPAFNNITAAVIYGESGSGKSTLLRRLAIDCLKEAFIVLWITNLRLFETSLNIIENEPLSDYLLIIDNWDEVCSNIPLTTRFLSKIKTFSNVRLVAGNVTEIDKSFLLNIDKKTFFLSFKENNSILDKIGTLHPDRQDIIKQIKEKSDLLKHPIYVVLFIIFHAKKKPQYIESNDLALEFRNIIEKDYLRLYNLHKGAAISLKFFSDLVVNYNFHFTWQHFTEVANGFEQSFSGHLTHFNPDNQICDLLSKYIYVDVAFVIPGMENERLVYFHHHLLTKGGLTHGNIPELSDFIRSKICNRFYRTGLFLYHVAVYEKIKVFRFIQLVVYSWTDYAALPLIIYFNNVLISYYQQADSIEDETHWEINLYLILSFFNFFNVRAIKVITKHLIDNGCKATIIHKVYLACCSKKFKSSPHDVISDLSHALFKKYEDVLHQQLLDKYFERAAFLSNIVPFHEKSKINNIDDFESLTESGCYAIVPVK